MSAALIGLDAYPVEVEVRMSAQLPRIDIVGLAEASVRESAARVRAAIGSAGERFPQSRITVNLAPAALRKSGAALDLAIAIGILQASAALEPDAANNIAFIGELALDGRLRPVRGLLAMALAARAAGCSTLILPIDSAPHATLARDIRILGAPNLPAVIEHLRGGQPLREVAPTRAAPQRSASPCLSDVRGQTLAKRGLVIAAAGGHGLLLVGPPGSGKTMLAERLPGLLPPPETNEVLEATRIYDLAGLLDETAGGIRERPFRAPHHSASAAGILGGGQPLRPGEISLAHTGVLFLDELPEFDRRVREAMRPVLEKRSITLARAGTMCELPADFLLACAANPCPCGWYGSPQQDCRCDERALERYRQRISGPLLDRIDLHVTVPAQTWSEINGGPSGATSAEEATQVLSARSRQLARTGTCNARLPDSVLDLETQAHSEALDLIGQAVDQLGLSARAARRVIRVARTISDLEGEAMISPTSIAEALTYRFERPQQPSW